MSRQRRRALLGIVIISAGVALLPAGSRPQPPAADPVSSHAATLLTDARLMVSGGIRAAAPSDLVEIIELGHDPLLMSLGVPRTSHTATLLPDGRVLVSGGAGARGPVDTLEVVDALAMSLTPLSARLPLAVSEHAAALVGDSRVIVTGGRDASGRPVATVQAVDVAGDHAVELLDLTEARAAHSATLLMDGRLLLLGGQGSSGLLDSAETWDPARLTATPLIGRLGTARAGHSATLLPSGEVLIVGGFGATGQPLATIERFNPTAGAFRTEAMRLPAARGHHSATLLPSGEVLVWGGVDAAGAPLANGEVLDPVSGRVRLVSDARVALSPDTTPPTLVASSPLPGAQNIGVQPLIVLRFSEPLKVTSVTAATVVLGGPGGPVPVAVVPAESGLLVLVTPTSPLQQGTTYTLRLERVMDTAGLPLAPTAVQFTTVGTAGGGQGISTFPDNAIPPGEDDTRIARDPRTGQPTSRWQSLPPLMAPPGVTAVSGQVLRLNGEPLANVTFTIEGVATRSDDTGRFLIANIPPGPRVLTMDGRSANTADATYGIFDVSVPVTPRQTNVLPYTIWMPKLDTVNVVRFPSPTTGEVVISTPKIPGFEIHLAPGTVVEDRDGRPLTQLSITPIPPDRPPFPLPESFAMYFTIQPNGASLTRGARVVYPNVGEAPAGQTWDFWSYEAEGGTGWYRYGKGTVGSDGRQIHPDLATRIYKITVHGCCPLDGNPMPPVGPPPGSDDNGDPVNLATGLFVMSKTDLTITDVVPISLRRTYRPGDAVVRAFGVGANHDYDISLVKVGTSFSGWQEAYLVLPDGGRVHYVLIQSGPNWPVDWRYQHTETPTAFFKSRLIYNSVKATWDLTFKDGAVWAFGDHSGRLMEMRDRYGNTVTVTRRNLQTGQIDPINGTTITRITSPNGRSIELNYDTSSRIVEATDNIGRAVKYAYDGSGRLLSVTDPAGSVKVYTYDGAGRMDTVTDARGTVKLRNEYYLTGTDTGRVKKQTLADPTLTYQFTYTNDANGKVIQTDVTDPRGIVRRYAFNSAGYTVSDTMALGLPEAQTVTYERDPDPAKGSRVTAVVDPLGRRTEYDYDASSQVTTIRRLAGTADQITSTFTYEGCLFDAPSGFCRILSVVPNTAVTDGRVTYNYSGLTQTTITDPRGQATTITYNAAGQPIQALSPLSAPAVSYGYSAGNRTSVTDRLGRTTTWTYDAAARRIGQTDPSGRTTSWVYNAVNRLVAVGDDAGGVTRFTWDPNGNLLSVRDARSNVTTYVYDAMNRLQSRTDPLGKSELFQFDGNGNLTRYTDRKGQVTTFVYDGLNRRTATAGPGYTVTRTWDAGNRLTQIADSAGGTITEAWDLLDRLTSQTTALGTVAYQYDVLGRRTQMTVPGQAAITYMWDAASRLTQIAQGTQTVALSYDNVNRRTFLTLPNGVSTEYQYDTGSRLTAVIYRNGAGELGRLTYDYDAGANRANTGGSLATTLLPDAVAAGTYDAGNRQVTLGSKTLTYDDNGSLIRITEGADVTDLTWDSRNRLTALSAPGPTTAAFTYDAVGRRAAKTINGQTTQFQYDGVDLVREVMNGTTVGYLGGPGIDEPLVRGGSEFYLAGAIGSIVALTDASGAIATSYQYDPFGRSATQGGASTNPMQYTGRENDGTGLQYSRARYYSAALHRFISEDPTGLTHGTNLYAYVSNNPTALRDPLGLFEECWAFAEVSCNDGPPPLPPPIDCLDGYPCELPPGGGNPVTPPSGGNPDNSGAGGNGRGRYGLGDGDDIILTGAGGPEKMETQLPDGRIINKATPAKEIRDILKDQGLKLSEKQVKILKGILKVVKRGGLMIYILGDIFFLDPPSVEPGTCPAGPGTCQ